MDDSEHDVLAYMTFPSQHRTKLHSTDEIDKPFRCDLRHGRPRGKELGSGMQARPRSLQRRSSAAPVRRFGLLRCHWLTNRS
jgi:hypothetical protein